jgi:hypothetical protein
VSAVAALREHRHPPSRIGWRAVLGGLAMTLAMAGSAQAFWVANGWGGGGGQVATLPAPSLGASPGAGTATLTWTAVTPPGPGSVTYFVVRNGGNPAGNCPTQAAPASVLTCTDGGLSQGTYTYTVTAVWLSWTATSSPAQATLASGPLDHFVLTAATTTPTAGQADSMTVTAKDAAGNTVTAYAGTQCISFSGPGTSPNGTAPSYPAQGSCAAGQSDLTFTNGVAPATVTLYKAETVSVVVSDGSGHSNGSGLSVTVAAAGLTAFTIPTPAAQTAGTGFTISITAGDPYGNVATGYTGPKCLAFSGPASSPAGDAPVYPAQGSCLGGQSEVVFTNGVAASVPITLYNASASTTLTATEGSVTGSTGTFAVNGAAVAGIVLSSITTSPVPALSCSGSIGAITCSSTDEAPSSGQILVAMVTLYDQYGNVTTNAGGSSIGIDLATSGQGSVSPSGADALSVAVGSSETSASFTLTRSNGNNKTVTMTATVHGTTQTLTVTLSS